MRRPYGPFPLTTAMLGVTHGFEGTFNQDRRKDFCPSSIIIRKRGDFCELS